LLFIHRCFSFIYNLIQRVEEVVEVSPAAVEQPPITACTDQSSTVVKKRKRVMLDQTPAAPPPSPCSPATHTDEPNRKKSKKVSQKFETGICIRFHVDSTTIYDYEKPVQPAGLEPRTGRGTIEVRTATSLSLSYSKVRVSSSPNGLVFVEFKERVGAGMIDRSIYTVARVRETSLSYSLNLMFSSAEDNPNLSQTSEVDLVTASSSIFLSPYPLLRGLCLEYICEDGWPVVPASCVTT
jgi:hypothetical protein